MAYPGSMNQNIEIPVSTRIMERPAEQATPRERLMLIALPGMAPEVISSTCSVNT